MKSGGDDAFRAFLQTQGSSLQCCYACITGSGATGLESVQHSDLDVRFIFVRPLSAYITIRDGVQQAEVVNQINNDIDVEGWDLRKFLVLLHRSNARAFEWLASPTLGGFCEAQLSTELCQIAKEAFSAKKIMLFYLNDARMHARKFLGSSKPLVLHKKYIFVVKPILSILWILRYGSRMPPLAWDAVLGDLKDTIPELVLVELSILARNKREGLYSGENSEKLRPHLVQLEAWYQPLLVEGSDMELRIQMAPDLSESERADLQTRMDEILLRAVLRLNGLR